MNRQELIDYLEPYWSGTISQMGDAIHSDIKLLNETNDRLFSHSGKMMRPMLSLLIAKACAGEPNEDSCKYAASTELLHNATLMHDDVADGSMERRGVPTLNSLMGPRSAVLVGDFWLARASQTILSAQVCVNDVLLLFSQTLVDLAEGEMLQLEKAGTAATTEQDYFKIIYCKTASLFVEAALSGAFSVNAPKSFVDAAREYAMAAGLAFQIKDDILDYVGDESLGKPVGIDLMEQKITLPLLCAMKNSGREEEIREMVRTITDHPENCAVVRDFVVARGGVDSAASVLDSYIEKAVAALNPLPDTPAKDYLAELVRYNSFRKV